MSEGDRVIDCEGNEGEILTTLDLRPLLGRYFVVMLDNGDYGHYFPHELEAAS